MNSTHTEKHVKLIKSENGKQEYGILIDEVVGKGGFGVVYRAVNFQNQQEKLAVKTIPLQDPSKRSVVEAELKVLSELPIHSNLVEVKPVKVYSENNYYIFMEYCEGGSLYELAGKRRENAKNTGSGFSEQEIFDMFYQIVKGYKVLFDKKILHQDLKPDNILVRKNCYKLADFGLSIFYENFKFTNKREGTLNYIAPQKITMLEYHGNPKSDVYSLGVIFYQIIVGMHPYISRREKKRDLKEFIIELKQAKLTVPHGFSSKHSLQFMGFFEKILQMLSKNQANRISFEQVWEYVENSDQFRGARIRQKEQSKKYILEEFDDFVVSQVSKVLTVPFHATEQEQKEIRMKVEQQRQQEMKEIHERALEQISSFLLGRRVVVYFFDRLARKLIITQRKSKRTMAEDRCVFLLMLLNRSILNDITIEMRNPSIFEASAWQKFRSNPKYKPIEELIKKDDKYVEDAVCDLLAEDLAMAKKDVRDIYTLYREDKKPQLLERAKQAVVEVFKYLVAVVQVHNKRNLLTLRYAGLIYEILADVDTASQKLEFLESQFKRADTSKTDELWREVRAQADQWQISYSVDLTGLDEEQQNLIQEQP